MRELREALGTDEGYRKVFQKVFGKDIERLENHEGYVEDTSATPVA